MSELRYAQHPIMYITVRSDGKLFSNATNKEIVTRGQEIVTAKLRSNSKKSATKFRKCIILEAFGVANPHEWRNTRHKNGDKTDYRLKNLKWTHWNWNTSKVFDGEFILQSSKTDEKNIKICFEDDEEAERFGEYIRTRKSLLKFDETGNWEQLREDIEIASLWFKAVNKSD